jgi:hypothetical protein
MPGMTRPPRAMPAPPCPGRVAPEWHRLVTAGRCGSLARGWEFRGKCAPLGACARLVDGRTSGGEVMYQGINLYRPGLAVPCLPAPRSRFIASPSGTAVPGTGSPAPSAAGMIPHPAASSPGRVLTTHLARASQHFSVLPGKEPGKDRRATRGAFRKFGGHHSRSPASSSCRRKAVPLAYCHACRGFPGSAERKYSPAVWSSSVLLPRRDCPERQ